MEQGQNGPVPHPEGPQDSRRDAKECYGEGEQERTCKNPVSRLLPDYLNVCQLLIAYLVSIIYADLYEFATIKMVMTFERSVRFNSQTFS